MPQVLFPQASACDSQAMAEIVNLRLARKAKARRDAESAAAANRARHGEGKAAKARRTAEAEREERRLAGLRLDSGEEGPA